MYLGWYDDSKKDTAAKMVDAIAAYQARFHALPSVVLCSPDEDAPERVAGCTVRHESYIRRNNYWVGLEAH